MALLLHAHQRAACLVAAAFGCATFGTFAQTADILWRNTATGQNVVWKAGNHLDTKPVADAETAWHVIGTSVSSFNGLTSVIWRNRVDGRIVGWPSAESDAAFSLPTVPKQSWTLAGMGYFDTATQLFDLLWRDSATGRNLLWRVGGNTTSYLTTVTNQDWKIVGVGDFDNDLYSDILWRNQATGANAIWLRANARTQQPTPTVTNIAWEVVGVGDFDGDSNDDILWREAKTGRNAIWNWGHAGAYAKALPTVSVLSWRVVGIADFDGDGKDDLLWRDAVSGRNVIWRSANAALSIRLATVSNPAWIVAAVGDFKENPWDY
jgi:hypothetical protein